MRAIMIAGDFQLEAPLKARRIVVAMSGGVDSSVVAALAAATGAETIGVTLQLYDHGEAVGRAGSCCAGRDIRDARAVCDRLGIAHYVFDHASRFKTEVIDDFADEYLAGRTPIPCVKCNMGPKFTDLFALARDLGADCLATGHYVRRVLGPQGAELHRAHDPARDQSYFLFATTAAQLDFLRFPLGGMPKPQVRELAAELGLGVAGKPDSQDICFVPDGDYTAFIERYTGEMAKPGDFVDKEGKVLGRHEGITHYTIGQRRGLRFPAKTRIYVQKIDPVTNQVVLGKNEDLFTTELTANELNLITCDKLTEPLRVTAKVRYRHKEQPALAWQTEDGKLHVRFDQPQRAITRGQAVVLYQGDLVIGGGVIE